MRPSTPDTHRTPRTPATAACPALRADRGSSRPRSQVGGGGLRNGARVVAVVSATATTIEILGHGTYQHGEAAPELTRRLTLAIESSDRVAIDYAPMLDTICKYMSPDRARETRSRFHSRNDQRRSRPAGERARDLARSLRGNQRVQLDSGASVRVEDCWLVPAEEFGVYADGCTVKVVTAGA